MTAGLMLVDVSLRRHAWIAHDALRLTLFFSCRFADQWLRTLIIALDESWRDHSFS